MRRRVRVHAPGFRAAPRPPLTFKENPRPLRNHRLGHERGRPARDGARGPLPPRPELLPRRRRDAAGGRGARGRPRAVSASSSRARRAPPRGEEGRALGHREGARGRRRPRLGTPGRADRIPPAGRRARRAHALLRGRRRDGGDRPPGALARDLRAGRRAGRGVDAHVRPDGPAHLRRFLQRRKREAHEAKEETHHDAAARAAALFTFEESESSVPFLRRLHGPRDPVSRRRRARRGGPEAPRAAADRGRRRGSRSVRHDGRGRDARRGRARARRRDHRGGGARRRPPRQGHRGLRLERHEEVAAPRGALPRRGGRRPSRRDAVLQQADAPRPRGALRGRRGRRTASDRRVQRAGPHRPQHAPRHGPRARAGPADRGREGGLGQPRPGLRDPAGPAVGIRGALGRGLARAPDRRVRRRRRHRRRLERGARAARRAGGGRARRATARAPRSSRRASSRS